MPIGQHGQHQHYGTEHFFTFSFFTNNSVTDDENDTKSTGPAIISIISNAYWTTRTT
jgi:hypothetical protein